MRTTAPPRVMARLTIEPARIDGDGPPWRAWLYWPGDLASADDEHTYVSPDCDSAADARRAAHNLADRLDLDVIEGRD